MAKKELSLDALLAAGDVDRMYPAGTVAKLFSVTTETVRDWISAGKVEGRKIGNRWYVTHSSILAHAQKKL